MGSRTVVRVTDKIINVPVMSHKARVPKSALCEATNEVFCTYINQIKSLLETENWGEAIDKFVDFKTARDVLIGGGCPIKKCPKPPKGRKPKTKG